MKLLYALSIPIMLLGHGGEKHETQVEVPKKVVIQQDNKDIYADINNKYLKDIKPIFEKKCFDCHSNKTKYPWYFKLPIISGVIENDIKKAKEHLDFSNDFPFISHDTPQKDLVSILKSAEKKSMPPFQYRIMHSDSKITDEDIKIIKAWVDSSLEQINKNIVK